MKTYQAIHKACNEKIDSCIAMGRLNAAKYFANKKKISLKDWLKIYTVKLKN